jgi:hypothetical protein
MRNNLEDELRGYHHLAGEEAAVRRAFRQRADGAALRPSASPFDFLSVCTIWSATLSGFVGRAHPLHAVVNGAIAGMVIGLLGIVLRSFADGLVTRGTFHSAMRDTVSEGAMKLAVIAIFSAMTVAVLAALVAAPIWTGSETGRQGIQFIWKWRFARIIW